MVYVNVGSGGSYSLTSDIYADPVFWDAAPQGYNAALGSTALYSVALGYQVSPLLSADVEYIYRPKYSYSRYQTPPKRDASFFVGNVTRNFNLESNSLMVNAYLHGAAFPDMLVYKMGHEYFIEPFIGGGLGVSFNTMSNFKSLKPDGFYVSYALDNFRTSLSGQASAGLRLYNQSNFSLEAGYRYYNGGTFTSQNFVLDGTNLLTPWKGAVQANEFFLRLSYSFDSGASKLSAHHI